MGHGAGAELSGIGPASKSYIALRFADARGVELYELSLRRPAAPKTISGDNTGAGSDANVMGQWVNFFPKIGVYGIALIGVFLWNLRKLWGKDHEKMETHEEDFYMERIKQNRAERYRRKTRNGEDGEEESPRKPDKSSAPRDSD